MSNSFLGNGLPLVTFAVCFDGYVVEGVLIVILKEL